MAIAKPKNDIFVVLLAIAVAAIVIGCILLMIELSNYGWSVKAAASLPAAPGSLGASGLAMNTQLDLGSASVMDAPSQWAGSVRV